VTADRVALGRLVRETWVKWAKEQPNPKPSWLAPWEDLPEPDREVDRRIGETIAARGVADELDRLADDEMTPWAGADSKLRRLAAQWRDGNR
jgi:hypothetical protein